MNRMYGHRQLTPKDRTCALAELHRLTVDECNCEGCRAHRAVDAYLIRSSSSTARGGDATAPAPGSSGERE